MITFDTSGNTHLLWQQESEAWYIKLDNKAIRAYIPDAFKRSARDLRPHYTGIAAETNAYRTETKILLIDQTGEEDGWGSKIYVNYTIDPSNGHLTGAYDRHGNFLSIKTKEGVDQLNQFANKWDDQAFENAEKRFFDFFDDVINPSSSKGGGDGSGGDNKLTEVFRAPKKFKKKTADKITNFNPSTDTLEIDSDSFRIDSSATFAVGKNKKAVKKKLAKQDFDFLYDEKKGGLYFNENGSDKGFGDGGIIAILKGAPDLTSGNLEFS